MTSTSWYCFRWVGRTTDLKDSDYRDPSQSVPPLVVWRWLEKPSPLRALDADSPGQAVDWLLGEASRHRLRMRYGERVTHLEELWVADRARSSLHNEHTVVWSFWLDDGNRLELAVVPNETVEKHLHV